MLKWLQYRWWSLSVVGCVAVAIGTLRAPPGAAAVAHYLAIGLLALLVAEAFYGQGRWIPVASIFAAIAFWAAADYYVVERSRSVANVVVVYAEYRNRLGGRPFYWSSTIHSFGEDGAVSKGKAADADWSAFPGVVRRAVNAR